MTPLDLAIAQELKRRLSATVDLLDFKVFGSRARGSGDDYSDMDIFLEVESLDREKREKIEDIVWEVGFENHLVISPLIFTRYEMEETALRSSSIVQSIAEEGIRI